MFFVHVVLIDAIYIYYFMLLSVTLPDEAIQVKYSDIFLSEIYVI